MWSLKNAALLTVAVFSHAGKFISIEILACVMGTVIFQVSKLNMQHIIYDFKIYQWEIQCLCFYFYYLQLTYFRIYRGSIFCDGGFCHSCTFILRADINASSGSHISFFFHNTRIKTQELKQKNIP